MEISGVLTDVMGEMQQIPDWFQNEKIHRFDGSDEGVRLYKDSRPLSENINPDAQHGFTTIQSIKQRTRVFNQNTR